MAAVAELKAHLSAFLKKVKAGQEVVITEHGIPIARIVPIRGDEKRESWRQELAAAGLLRLGTGNLAEALRRLPPAPRVEGVLDALLAERQEERDEEC